MAPSGLPVAGRACREGGGALRARRRCAERPYNTVPPLQARRTRTCGSETHRQLIAGPAGRPAARGAQAPSPPPDGPPEARAGLCGAFWWCFRRGRNAKWALVLVWCAAAAAWRHRMRLQISQ